jgi:predicted DNA-binding transcriptional regulator YafY
MRADRLIAMLMLLQARGRMTAQALAVELEVAERTIYRDVDALGAAGVPLYCEAGPGGGIELLDSYRTTLTGLTDAEVRALFSLSVPETLAPLELDGDLRAALRKLAAALPAARRTHDALQPDVFIDAEGWGQGEEPVPHLLLLHRAVRARRCVALRYRRFSGAEVTATVAPLGLVAKAGAWHLVFQRADRTWALPVADVLEADLTEEPFAPPAGFDLARSWQELRRVTEQQRALYTATVRASPAVQRVLPRYFGDAIRARLAQGARDAGGWVTLTLTFATLDAARAALLAFGGGVEVLAPEPLRRSLLDYAEQITMVYEKCQK